MTPSPTAGDLPADLAHPRRDRASLIANLITGGVLLTIVILAVCTYFALR